MKKIVMLITAAFLVTGVSFAQDSKKCEKGKNCCKKGSTASKEKAAKKTKTVKV
jgi:hypothetical protein